MTDDDIAVLTDIAYRVSLRPEEGRYPRFGFHAYWDEAPPTDFGSEARFDPALLCDFETVRKIAAAVPSDLHRLVVCRRNGLLRIEAIEAAKSWFASGEILEVPRLRPQTGHGVALELVVSRPGELRITEGPTEFQLTCGMIYGNARFYAAATVRQFFESTSSRILQRIAVIPGETQEQQDANRRSTWIAIQKLLVDTFEAVLSRIRTVGHGGALVVTPPDMAPQHLRPRHTLTWPSLSDLVEELIRHWLNRSFSSKQSMADFVAPRTRLADVADTIASLSQMDGCVVLDAALRLNAIGAEIVTSEHDATSSSRVFKDFETGDAYPSAEQGGQSVGGNRHRSAFRLCKSIPGGAAFVVSQDGELSFFNSTESAVYCYRSLSTIADLTSSDFDYLSSARML